MINIAESLAEDILAGIKTAQEDGKLELKGKLPPVFVMPAAKPEHGDYACPVALALTKIAKKSPLDIVTIIAEYMPKGEYVGKLEGVAPGFLNVRLNPGWLTSRLDNLLEEEVSSTLVHIGGGKKLNFEFISANPTGPLTLGNVRTAFSVDTLANVLTFAGYNVTREYYLNDAGEQIKKLGASVIRRILQAQGESVDFPPELYQGEYITEVALVVAESFRETRGQEFTIEDLEDEAVMSEVSRLSFEHLLGHIKRVITDELKIKFDVWTSERQIRASGVIEETLAILKRRGETVEKDGAVWLKTTNYGDDKDRVLVKKNGEYAYFLPDIAYHQDKYKRGFDQIYTFVGADHQGLPPKLKAAMQALGHDVSKLHIILAQWMRFVRGGESLKLSKRAGQIMTPEDLISEVGYDCARFFMVQHALTTHMDFDLDLAKERSERNPVFYVQYSYVRLQSIIRRAKQEGLINEFSGELALTSHGLLTHTSEVDLMREMFRFPEVIENIADTFDVQSLTYYATTLAKAIHVFYKNVPVLSADDVIVKQSRLQLVFAARKVMGITLDLLGIEKLDVM